MAVRSTSISRFNAALSNVVDGNTIYAADITNNVTPIETNLDATNPLVEDHEARFGGIERTSFIKSFDDAKVSTGSNSITVDAGAIVLNTVDSNYAVTERTGWANSGSISVTGITNGVIWAIYPGLTYSATDNNPASKPANAYRIGTFTNNAGTVTWNSKSYQNSIDSDNHLFEGNVTFRGGVTLNNPVPSVAVAANALTLTVKGGTFRFRSATATSGDISTLTNTGSLAITIPSGTTLGTTNTYTQPVHIYALNNAGTIELAFSLHGEIDTTVVQSTSAISGGTSPVTLYSTTARSNVPIVYLGRMVASQTTAGTWASAPTVLSLCPQDLRGYVTLLDSTVSGVASVTLTSFNANLFKNIKIQGINIIPATDDTELLLRTSTDNGSTYDAGTGYSTTAQATSSAGGSSLAAWSGSAYSGILLGDSTAGLGISNVATDLGWNGTINASNLGSGVHKEFDFKCKYSYDGTILLNANGGGMRRTTSVVNGLQLLFAQAGVTPSGNIASGRIIITGELF